MDMDYDDFYSFSSSSGSPPKKKPYQTSKNRRDVRHKDYIAVAKTPKMMHQQPAQSFPGSNSTTRASEWCTKNMMGAHPPYNDNSCWVYDPTNYKVYMIGGIRPLDQTFEPTSDFYCYDTRTMKWEDLTDAMTFRAPTDPYCDIEVEKAKKLLPSLSQPGCALWQRSKTSFIFMFGGYDSLSEQPSSRTIIINLKTQEWWYEENLALAVGITPRIASSAVAINNRIYLFGGYRSYEVNSQACCSYSIAEWNPPSESSPSYWRWHCLDIPYTLPMPCKAVIGQAISVYDGKLIFLAPGRTNEHDRENKFLKFTDENLFFFRPADEAFQSVRMLGEGPKNIGWCCVFDLQSTMTPTVTSLPLASNAFAATSLAYEVPRKRGRPRKYLPPSLSSQGSSQSSLRVPQKSPLFPAIPSIVVCAWIAQPSTPGGLLDLERLSSEDLTYAPEIWRFVFSPVDECEPLNVMGKIAELGQDIQGFTVADGRMHLLGSDLKRQSERSQGICWNIFIDIPNIHRLNN